MTYDFRILRESQIPFKFPHGVHTHMMSLIIAVTFSLIAFLTLLIFCCCCSASRSYPAVCDPMDCSTPGFPILHCLPELAQTYVHRVGDAIQPSRPLLSPFPPAFNLSQPSGSFLMSRLFVLGGHGIGASISASVLPASIQGWFPVWLTGLISLLSKGLSRAFSSTTVQLGTLWNCEQMIHQEHMLWSSERSIFGAWFRGF